jgi:MFS family permease
MLVAMFLIPLSSVAMATSAWFSDNVNIFGIDVHPITFMMVIGIAIQGLAECFLSPKWLEFASKQAPRGKEGVFLGFAHINTFFAWMFGFIFSGYLLKKYRHARAAHAGARRAGADARGLRTRQLPVVVLRRHWTAIVYRADRLHLHHQPYRRANRINAAFVIKAGGYS